MITRPTACERCGETFGRASGKRAICATCKKATPGSIHPRARRRQQSAPAVGHLPSTAAVRFDGACVTCGLIVLKLEDDGRCLSCSVADITEYQAAFFRSMAERCRRQQRCIYCGEPSDHIEHVVPRRMGLPTWTVPSCAECNLLAAGTAVYDLHSKQDLIHGRLRRRYQDILALPDWTEEQIKELKYNLRTYVRASLQKRERIRHRLNWSIFNSDSDGVRGAAAHGTVPVDYKTTAEFLREVAPLRPITRGEHT